MADTIYYDTYNEGEAPEETGKGKRLLKIVLTALFSAAVVFMLAFFFYRMWEMRDPRGVNDYLWTETALEASLAQSAFKVNPLYANGEKYAYEQEDLTTVTLTEKAANKSDWKKITLGFNEYYTEVGFRVYTAGIGTYTEENSDGSETVVKCTGYYENPGSPVEGALRISGTYFTPAAKQVQLTFRCKSDVLEKLNGVPAEDGSLFRFALANEKNDLYTVYSYKTAKRGVYRYITMIFEGVDLSSVQRLDLAAEYLTERGTCQTLFLYVYDHRIQTPVRAVDVKPGNVSSLPVYQTACLPPDERDLY